MSARVNGRNPPKADAEHVDAEGQVDGVDPEPVDVRPPEHVATQEKKGRTHDQKIQQRPVKIYFSIWMAMVQTILKKTDLASMRSLNYYYNSKRGLLERTEKDMTLEEMYEAFNVHKLSADFKMNQLKAIASRQANRVTGREEADGPVQSAEDRHEAQNGQEKGDSGVEKVAK